MRDRIQGVGTYDIIFLLWAGEIELEIHSFDQIYLQNHQKQENLVVWKEKFEKTSGILSIVV